MASPRAQRSSVRALDLFAWQRYPAEIEVALAANADQASSGGA